MRNLAIVGFLVLTGFAGPAWGQSLEEVCNFTLPVAPDWTVDVELPGVSVEAHSATVGPLWPPRQSLDPEGWFAAPDGERVLAAVPIVSDSGDTAWAALLVPESVASNTTLGEWLNADKTPTMRLWWVSPFGRGGELQSFSLANETYEWGVPAEELDLAVRLRVEGTRLLEVCVPGVYGNSEDVEGTGVDEEWVERTCFEVRDFADPRGSCDMSLQVVLQERVGNNGAFDTFRDVTADGVPEFLAVRGNWELGMGSPEPKPQHVLAYISGSKDKLVALAQQPMWREAVSAMHQTHDLETLRMARSRLVLLAGATFSPADAATLTCAKQFAERQMAELRLAAGDDTIAAWAFLTGLEGEVDFDEALYSVHAFDVQRLPWDLGEVELGTGFVQWDTDRRLRLTAVDRQVVCERTSGRCFPTCQSVALPSATNPAGTQSLDCVMASTDSPWVVFQIAPAGEAHGTLRDCACVYQDEELDGLGELDFHAPLSELGADGLLSEEGADCGWGGERYPGLGVFGWLDDNHLLYASRGKFYSVSPKGNEALAVGEVPEQLASLAGLSADRKSRLFLAAASPERLAVFRADVATGLVEFVMALPSGIAGSPGSWVVASPSGARFVVVVNGVVVGAYAFPRLELELSDGEQAPDGTQTVSSEAELAAKLGLGADTPRATRDTNNPTVAVVSTPSGALAKFDLRLPASPLPCELPPSHVTEGSWWLVAGETAWALEFGDALRLWTIDPARGCLVFVSPFESPYEAAVVPSVTVLEKAADGAPRRVRFEVALGAGAGTVEIGSDGLTIANGAAETLFRQAFEPDWLPADPSIEVMDSRFTTEGNLELRIRLGQDDVELSWAPGRGARLMRQTNLRSQRNSAAFALLSSYCSPREDCASASKRSDEEPFHDSKLTMVFTTQYTMLDTVLRLERKQRHDTEARADFDTGCGQEWVRRQTDWTWSVSGANPEPVVLAEFHGEVEEKHEYCQFTKQNP